MNPLKAAGTAARRLRLAHEVETARRFAFGSEVVVSGCTGASPAVVQAAVVLARQAVVVQAAAAAAPTVGWRRCPSPVVFVSSALFV